MKTDAPERDDDLDRRIEALRADLLDAQYKLLEAGGQAVVVLINGVDGAGKGETMNLLAEWMDARHLRAEAFVEPTAEEAGRPPLWRFWRALPPKGHVGLLFGNWYTMPILARVERATKRRALAQQIERIRRFEKLLADEGVRVVKLWFHLSKKAQRRRLEGLERHRRTRWRVTERDWAHFAKYDRFRRVSEEVRAATGTDRSPWKLIDGPVEDGGKARAALAGEAVLEALLAAAEPQEARGPAPTRPAGETSVGAHTLRTLPFTERLGKPRYEEALELAQGRLFELARAVAGDKKHPPHPGVVVLFEGMDAAGKGGAIRRLVHPLDARQYRVVPIAAPTEEERKFPYLWRFWRHLPGPGRVQIFDRSWYGRVLVERVEGFADEPAIARAFDEIVDFEEQLVGHGYVLCKFWLAVSKEEQLRRFKERETTRFKRFKITPEDWRNREKWDAYQAAAGEMIDRTSTADAPWQVIEADDKHLARVQIVEAVCEALAPLRDR